MFIILISHIQEERYPRLQLFELRYLPTMRDDVQ